jgi:hypothetical protein
MAKILIANKKRGVAEFMGGGKVEAQITALPRGQFTQTIRTNRLNGINAATLADYADALRKVCKHVGSVVGKPVSLSGLRADPDEPTLDPEKDLTVTLRVFRNNPQAIISFTRYAATGQIEATVPLFSLTNDIPSAVQLAFVANQAAELMKKYVDV